MTTYGSEQTATWTQADLDALTGKTITLIIEGHAVARRRCVSVARSGIGPVLVFEFRGGGSWTVGRADPEVQITVHD